MSTETLVCRDDVRQEKIRESGLLNGLDYVEVALNGSKAKLTVALMHKLTDDQRDALKGHNAVRHVVLEGGRRIPAREIKIEKVDVGHSETRDRDDVLTITTDKSGDFSDYTLRLVDLEDQRPSDRPMQGFDLRYASITFNFKANCPSDLDCKTRKVCPPEKLPEPDINYLAKDYASFRQLILDRLSQTMPDWQERHIPDTGMAIAEAMAYVGDYLSYYQDAVATEAYLDTARKRISVRRHARLVDYRLHEGNNARTWVHVALDGAVEKSFAPDEIYFMTALPEGAVLGKVILGTELTEAHFRQVEVFEPLVEDPEKDLHFYEAHNEIEIYTWGDTDCCLPKGATRATLKYEWREELGQNSDTGKQNATQAQNTNKRRRVADLKEGDFLLFEEVKGAKNGNPEDADKSHKHVVRLTKVTPDTDALYKQKVVEIEWGEEDALPFPVCVSAIGLPPDCCMIENISVARGNIVLADHGRSLREEELGTVPLQESKIVCLREHRPSDQLDIPAPFEPQFEEQFLTFRDLPKKDAPAAKQLTQDPRNAVPQITLTSSHFNILDEVEMPWQAVRDLLRSSALDNHFVVEMDDERKIHLRFGDGELGRQPQAGMEFTASYRTGNGPAGNIGAERIAHVVHRTTAFDGISLTPTNPFPAVGGNAPEPLSEAKFFAPTTFRKKIERAITPADYQLLAEQFEGVQRAAATFRWTGSWYETRVAIDPFGGTAADQAFLDSIREHLEPFRRMGHDLVVNLAEYVPIDLEMLICVLPGYTRGHVKAALLEVFGSGRLPDGSLGFFHPDNLTFGQSIRLSKLVAIAQKVAGVESVDVTRLERLFEGPNREIDNGILPIQPFEIPRLDNDPSFPENGRLTLNMRGER